ncbi:MAG: GxxExxY protein [Parcubacteria group bacterium]|nr:GxxExxY protein [Parcubacteria group bacterium]
MDRKQLHRSDIIYPELSYQIIGVAFDVFNELGYGQKEISYQKAIAVGFIKAGLKFREQVYYPVIYRDKQVGKNYFDFLVVEGKVIVEVKRGDRFAKSHIDQLYRYLVTADLKLGLLVYFAPHNIHFKRIVNL